MKPPAVGVVVFVCTLGGALLGAWLRRVLPAHHLEDASRDTMKLGIGLVATLTALVLGLVTASTKSTFDDLSRTIKQAAVDVLEIDRALGRYGPETRDIRLALERIIRDRIEVVWAREASLASRLDTAEVAASIEALVDQIRALTPQTGGQRALQAAVGGLESSVPWPFLTILLFWLTITFACFGVLAPSNSTVLSVLFVCALSVAAAVFLVLEMDGPFEGVIQVSPEPLRYALTRLGQ